MNAEKAAEILMNDWYILDGQLCVDKDRVERFTEAIGVAFTALRAQTKLDRSRWEGCEKPGEVAAHEDSAG